MSFKGYTIVSLTTFGLIKMNIDIVLEKEVNKDRLVEIATKLYSSHTGIRYDRVFISYYLDLHDLGKGAWATTHYNPILKVNIWGKELEDYEREKSKRDEKTRD